MNPHNLPLYPGTQFNDNEQATLRLRLDIYDDMVLATRFDRSHDRTNGHQIEPSATFLVDPDDLAARLAGLDLTSGLLPHNCLFWQKRGGRERIGVYVEPGAWELRVDSEIPNRLVPLPGFVFVGHGVNYNLWAVKERPANADAELFAAPVPNLDGRGACAGSVDFPKAGPETIWQAVDLFFESGFNAHLANGKSVKYPESVLRMWRVLDRCRAVEYPLGDLVPVGKLGSVL